MRYLVLLVLLMILPFVLRCQELPAYRLYNVLGEEIEFGEMITQLDGADVILFGEMHENPIAHWLELEVTKALFESVGDKLVLGAEMFEADNQLIIDEYLQGLIKTNHFEDNVRLWNNYSTDYKPLVEFAVANGLGFIATNIPRRYASMVARGGFESLNALSEDAKRFIAPLPMPYDGELNCYKQMMNMNGMPGKMHSDNLPKAQASKDATMAINISRNMPTDGKFLHFNGRYHSDNKESIVWYLDDYAPDLKVMTISTTLNQSLAMPAEELNFADFMIVIPESMTRTY